jgi:hypothetical protein
MSIGQGVFVLHDAEVGGFPQESIMGPLPHWQALPRSHVIATKPLIPSSIYIFILQQRMILTKIESLPFATFLITKLLSDGFSSYTAGS